jgi:hypothetical protein
MVAPKPCKTCGKMPLVLGAAGEFAVMCSGKQCPWVSDATREGAVEKWNDANKGK